MGWVNCGTPQNDNVVNIMPDPQSRTHARLDNALSSTEYTEKHRNDYAGKTDHADSADFADKTDHADSADSADKTDHAIQPKIGSVD